MTLLLVFVALAIGVSFLCSLLEATLLSITPSFVEAAREGRPRLAERLSTLRTDIDRPLAAILSLNTIAHTVGATGAGAQAAVVFGDAGVGVFSAVLTLGILVLSEIVPKTLGATWWRQLAPFCVAVLPWLIRVQLPLVWMSQGITRLLTRGRKDAEISREEITALTTAGRKLGIVDEEETRIVENLFDLDQRTVEEIMTPRTVMATLPAGGTVGEVLERRDAFRFSRLPLVRDTPDDVAGYVLARDVLLAGVEGRTETPLAELGRDLARVPADMDLDALFDALVAGDRHVALVEDAHGGTAGFVTVEDLVESLLGTEIVDENDPAPDMRALAARRRARRAVAT